MGGMLALPPLITGAFEYVPKQEEEKEEVKEGSPKRKLENEPDVSNKNKNKKHKVVHVIPIDQRLHIRSLSIVFTSAGQYSNFTIHGKIHKGLTVIMKACFFPDYVYKKPTHGHGQNGQYVTNKHPFPCRRNPRVEGMSRGKLLDRLLTQRLEFLEEFVLPHRVFEFKPINQSKQTKEQIMDQYCQWILKCNKNVIKIKTAASRLKRMINGRNKHIQLLWKKWNEQQLQLIATQLSVGIPGVCATNIDCILRDGLGKIYIAEIKTGMQDYWGQTTGPMHSPYELLDNSHMNQAILQSALGFQFYKRTFPNLHPDGARVYRVTNKTVQHHIVQDWILSDSTFAEAIHVLSLGHR